MVLGTVTKTVLSSQMHLREQKGKGWYHEGSFKIHEEPVPDRAVRSFSCYSDSDVSCRVLSSDLETWAWQLGLSAGICSRTWLVLYDCI